MIVFVTGNPLHTTRQPALSFADCSFHISYPDRKTGLTTDLISYDFEDHDEGQLQGEVALVSVLEKDEVEHLWTLRVVAEPAGYRISNCIDVLRNHLLKDEERRSLV